MSVELVFYGFNGVRVVVQVFFFILYSRLTRIHGESALRTTAGPAGVVPQRAAACGYVACGCEHSRRALPEPPTPGAISGMPKDTSTTSDARLPDIFVLLSSTY